MTSMKITLYTCFLGDDTDFEEVKCLDEVLHAAMNIQGCGHKTHELKSEARIL